MAGLRLDFGMAPGYWPHEADADRLPHRGHPVLEHGERGCTGADALDERRHHASVHQPDRLAQLVANRNPRPSVLGVVIEPLGPDQSVEMGEEARRIIRHPRGPYPLAHMAQNKFLMRVP